MIDSISIVGGMGHGEPYQYAHQYHGQRRHVRIAIVGAGLSGIAAVKLFREIFPQEGEVSLVIYEKNADVTGTCCACDVPAHSYVYSWEGNPNWSRPYVGAVELYEYFKGRANAYQITDFVKLNHQVRGARWNTADGRWVLEVEDLKTGRILQDQAEVFINAAGFLNSWKWPDIDGLHTFEGKLIHSARWDDSYDFTDKAVGIIGSGSSGIQITPQLQPVVKHMTAFLRSPTWITPEFAAEFAPEGRTAFFSERQKEEWKNDKSKFFQYRKAVESSMNGFFASQFKKSQPARDACNAFGKTMRERLSRKPEIADLLVPTFSVGCRRVTPGHGYLEALTADNVTVRSDGIAMITGDGIQMRNGDVIELDALICATGFDTSFRPAFPIYGLHGQNLRDLWMDKPRSYLSIGAPQMPNYFGKPSEYHEKVFYADKINRSAISGPNFPLANGCLLPCLEQNVRYAFEAVRKIQHDGIQSIVPKTEAIDDFQEYKDSLMNDLVWSDHCVSWYKNGEADGKVWGPWPGSSLSYLELMKQPRWEDWDMTYRHRNRFHFLGNGRTEREVTGGDLAYYVREPGVNV